MKFKTIYTVLAGVAVVLTATCCSNFLEPDPKGQMVTENFFQSQNDLDMAVNALYYNVARAQQHTNPTIPQVQGDDITTTYVDGKIAYSSSDAFKLTPDYKGVNFLWSFQYNVIQAANLIIDNAEKVPTTQEKINVALGNAYFWRACAYFQLVRVFGPLPVNLHNEADNNSTPMSSVQDIYKLIVEDLTTADGLNLPATYDGQTYGANTGCNIWISQQAVKAALAAVYMNMAGWPLNLGTEYYDKAADLCKQVIDGVDAGTYPQALESDWANVYSSANNWSKEQLVTICYYDMPGQMGTMGDWVSQFCKCHRFSQVKNGWGDFVAERYWWSKYPAGPRKNAVYEEQIIITDEGRFDENGNRMTVDWWATTDEQPYTDQNDNSIIKVYHPMFAFYTINATEDGTPVPGPRDYRMVPYDGQSYPQNHRFIRYSEVLCWFAESVGRGTRSNYLAQAQQALQKVVDRAYDAANKPDVTTLSGAALAEAAYDEHSYEVTGNPISLVTRRSNEFRMDRLKQAWEYRSGAQDAVLVPAGTVTHSFKRVNIAASGRPKYVDRPYTYTLTYDVKLKEDVPMAPTWNGVESIYHPYPPLEVEKNPNIKRSSATI